MGSTEKNLREFPQEVKDSCVLGLLSALKGQQYFRTKVLKNFGGRNVLEIKENDRSGTYRVIYTVKFKKAVYVVHAFQKKSKKGGEVPKEDQKLIEKRLKDAEADYKNRFGKEG